MFNFEKVSKSLSIRIKRTNGNKNNTIKTERHYDFELLISNGF